MYELRDYVTGDGKDIVALWLSQIRDGTARVAIGRRLNRIENGNFGDHRFCRDGIWELRIDTGPGYRVYYALDGQRVVLLLCGGDKRTQSADITRACEYWKDWQRRPGS
jgi:putative addiction module killer protein